MTQITVAQKTIGKLPYDTTKVGGQKPNSSWYDGILKIQRGKLISDVVISDSAQYIPYRDTTFTPERIGAMTLRPQDLSLYIAISTNPTVKKWQKLLNSSFNYWKDNGNANTNQSINFIGTTDAQDVVFKANNTEQFRALSSGGIQIPNSTGSSTGVIFKGSDRFIHSFALPGTATNLGQNLHIGVKAGNFTYTGSSGGFGTRNLSIGDSTLYANTTGYRNVAIGVWAGAANTTGFENTVVGANTHEANTTGRQNTAVGAISLEFNSTGIRNTAVGFSSMQYNTTGDRNTAIGGRAMQNSLSSHANVSVGFDALAYNDVGDGHNTAVGLDALYYSNGSYNTALGDSTLWGLFGVQKHVGYKNTAIGSRAGYHLGDTYPNYASIYDTAATFLGANASRDSSIPYSTSLKNLTVIGYNARGYASNQVVLGNTDVTTTLLRGNVGIGINSPDSSLTVIGGGRFSGGLKVGASYQINTSGAVIAGTWNGTAIGTQYGGTGANNATNASGSFLRSNGSNGNYVASTLILPNAATTNYIVYATSPNTYGQSSGLTYDGATLNVSGTGSFTEGVKINSYCISMTTEGGGYVMALAGQYLFYANFGSNELEFPDPSLLLGKEIIVKNNSGADLVYVADKPRNIAGSIDTKCPNGFTKRYIAQYDCDADANRWHLVGREDGTVD